MSRQLDGATFGAVKIDSPLPGGPKYRLQMVATDISQQSMLVLPDDLVQYRDPTTGKPFDPDGFAIADAVRMSMSIPYFFQPVILTQVATGKSSTIVDGGVVSNFPVWIFDMEQTPPVRPTFGFHLTGGRGVGDGLQTVIDHSGWGVEEAVAIFHTGTDASDKRFMSYSTRVRTCSIDAGSVGTTDFKLTPEQQQELLASGREGAREFLAGYDPAEYMNTYGGRLVADSDGS
jgi:NTE family protein